MASSQSKKIVAALAILALLGGGYYFFFMESSTPATSTSTGMPTSFDPTIPSGDTGIIGQDILALVEQLKKVSVDPSLFTSPLFSNLTDFTISITPEAQGRANPFAALGDDSGQSIPSIRGSLSGTQ